jgi:hypothetical protein
VWTTDWLEKLDEVPINVAGVPSEDWVDEDLPDAPEMAGPSKSSKLVQLAKKTSGKGKEKAVEVAVGDIEESVSSPRIWF